MTGSLLKKWHHYFGDVLPEIVVRAPGRVNIIGEHTDYNDGWVMPGAISRSIYILIGRSRSDANHWVAEDVEGSFKSSTIPDDVSPVWAHYVYGVSKDFMSTHGAHNILIGGDLPVGAGLSSSSAMVCGLLYAFQKLYAQASAKQILAAQASQIEREITGLQGGIMDQYAVILSEDNKVMMLDCRTRTYHFLTAHLPRAKWILLNTKVSHQLVDSDYNTRAGECQAAAEQIRSFFPAVRNLRDVSLEMLAQVSLPNKLMQRSRFVVEENIRVHQMAMALEKHDAVAAGELIKASHAGLQYDYEVSCDELDHLATFANSYEGVYGARMMGGGFGGCVLCLLHEDILETFTPELIASYANAFGFEPDVIEFSLVGGVAEISL